MHVLRCSPCFGHHLLQEHDTVLREGLSAIVNIYMSDIHWLQASIPVKSGGLVIRRAVSLTLPAFLASAVATSDLQSAILSRGIQIVDKEVELLVFFGAHSLPPQYLWALFKPPKELGIRHVGA